MNSQISRVENWKIRLAEYLAETARRPFSYGSHDCALFAAGAVKAMTGLDYAAEWRGRYATRIGGLRVLRKAGHRDQIELARALFPAISRPRAGDLAVITTPDGPALGVVQGAMIYAPASVGWGLLPRDAATEFLEV